MTNPLNANRMKAVDILYHYLTWRKPDLQANIDTRVEIEQIVDEIIDAASVAAEERLMSRLRATEKRLSAAIRTGRKP